MHIWRISRDSWLLRLYLWAWDADPKSVNFCKLFWGTIFVFVPLVLMAGFAIATTINKMTPRWVKRLIRTTLTATTLGIFALIAGVILGLAVFVLILHPEILLYALAALAGIVLVVLGAIYGSAVARRRLLGVVTAGSETALYRGLGMFGRGVGSGAVAVGSPVGRMIKGLFGLLAAFYHAVKYRTCPVIEMVG